MQLLSNVYKSVSCCCLFFSQYSPKVKVKNLGLELRSVAHCYHLTLYISIWHLIFCGCSLKLSKLHVEMVSLVRNCSHTVALTSMTFEYKAQWIWIISPQFPKEYLGRLTQCPQATHSNALYHWKETLYILGFLLKGSPLSQPDLPIEYKNTLELSLTLFQPISFLRFHSTVVLPVNFHYCSWLRSAVSQTLQEEALKSVMPDLMSLNYWEN